MVRQGINSENPEALARSGNDLEAMACSAVCDASHAEGTAGCSIGSFLTHLAWNLGPGSSAVPSWAPGELGSFDLRIPFLSPMNTQWPTRINMADTKFGDLVRNKDSAQYDALAGDEVGVELKNEEQPLTTPTVKGCLQRMPCDIKFHLIICMHLQGEYFTTEEKKAPAVKGAEGEQAKDAEEEEKEPATKGAVGEKQSQRTPWEQFADVHCLQDCALLKIRLDQGQLSLSALDAKHIPLPPKPSRVVLLISLADLGNVGWGSKKAGLHYMRRREDVGGNNQDIER
jgi:hypothetical protein